MSALPVTLPVTSPSMGPTKLPAVTELPTEILFVTLAIPAMVIVEPPPTGLISQHMVCMLTWTSANADLYKHRL